MKTANILYVDDDRSTLITFVQMMRVHGLLVDTAGDGREALSKVAQKSYAVIVTDLRMPKMDGYELIEHLRRQLPNAVFIVVSAYLENTVSPQKFTGAVSGMYSKPWRETELVHSIKRALELYDIRSARNEDVSEQEAILLIESDSTETDRLLEFFREQCEDMPVQHCNNLDDAFRQLKVKDYSVIVSDLDLPDSEGLATVSRLIGSSSAPLIVLSDGSRDTNTARQALRLGAQELLEKSTLTSELLGRAIWHAVDRYHAHLQRYSHLNQTEDGILVVNDNGIILFANPAAALLWGDPLDRLQGTYFGYAIGSKGDLELQLKTGKYVEMYVQDTEWQGVHAQLVTLRDISERKSLQQNLHYLAYYDPLTGLGNRAQLADRLAAAVQNAKRNGLALGVLMLGLDRFKWVNDTMGHDAGDQLLKEIASRLYGVVRDSDTVTRSGGDEFVILAENNKNVENLSVLAGKVLACISEPCILANKEFNVTASIGIAVYPRDGSDEQSLLTSADSALYRAKCVGRNHCQFFNADIHRSSMRRLELESKLEQALKEGQFRLFMQPQLTDDEVVGAEILMRWKLPEGDYISPVEFIPLLEQSALIVDVEFWVLEQACGLLAQWRHRGINSSLAVNISSSTLIEPRLPDKIKSLLQHFSVPANVLELEITERILLDDTVRARKSLSELKEIGVHIALDDFGTGYSSLGYLMEFDAIDTLKLDCSFVWKMDETPRNWAILEAVVGLSHSLGMRIIAEGVETQRQLSLLRKLDCSVYQGFLFSRPVPAENWRDALGCGAEGSNK